jgi:hypothetical protein
MEQQPDVYAYILKIIHERSASEQLVQAGEILAEIREQGFLSPEDLDRKAKFETALKQVLEENQDLKAITGSDGIPCYYSVQSLSETYAGILMRKSESPLCQIAEVVRENSRVYPRPTPVDSFRESPFGLTREELVACLTAMREQTEYQDIAQTITSAGTSFLYSTQHLETDHAFALAEWLDVGQVNNP